MLAQEPAYGVVSILRKRSRLKRFAAVESGIAERELGLALGLIATLGQDIVDDGRAAAGINGRRAATHDLDALVHDIEAMHAFSGVEEVPVYFVEQRQTILLEDDVAAVGWNAAKTGDVLHFATGRFDMDA